MGIICVVEATPLVDVVVELGILVIELLSEAIEIEVANSGSALDEAVGAA